MRQGHTETALRSDADDVLGVAAPARFGGVGRWYSDFRQITDDEVLAALATRRRRAQPTG